MNEPHDPNAEDWYEEVQEIESDFILNEDHARAVAGREFIYQALSASSYNVVIVDDPRIEVGDILELADGSRVFVTGFRRELTHGTSAVLEVEGFRV